MPARPPLGFVHSSNGNISAESRRFVRSHAAVGGWVSVYNASRPRRHLAAQLLGDPSALGDYRDRDDFALDDWVDQDSLVMLYQHVGDPRTLAQSRVDPFDTLPIPHNPFVDMLLYHFFKRWILHVPELDPPAAPKAYTAKNWHMIRRSPVALTTHLLLSAGVIYVLRGVSCEKPSLLRLKHLALRLVNEAIDANCFEDEVLVSVIALCNYETIVGGEHELQTHVRGLKQMVDIRGGADSLGPLTRHMLMFSDKSIAFIAKAPRLFPQHIDDEIYHDIAIPEIDPSMQLQDGFKTLVVAGTVHEHLALPLLHFQVIFRKLCDTYGSPHWNHVISRDEWTITERMLDVVTLMSHITQLAAVYPFQLSKPYDVGECIRLAAVLLCYYLKQWCIPDFFLNEKVVAQLVTSVTNHAYEIFRQPNIHRLLLMEEAKALWWIFCIIGCTTSSKDRRSFFILNALRVNLQITAPEVGITILEDFIFDHRLFEQQYARLWTWMTWAHPLTVTGEKRPKSHKRKPSKAISPKFQKKDVNDL